MANPYLPPPRYSSILGQSWPVGERVFNAVGTSYHVPAVGDCWRDYHRIGTGDHGPFCDVSGCYKVAEVGAHVVKADGPDNRLYIARTCKPCNARSDVMTLTFGAKLVLAVSK